MFVTTHCSFNLDWISKTRKDKQKIHQIYCFASMSILNTLEGCNNVAHFFLVFHWRFLWAGLLQKATDTCVATHDDEIVMRIFSFFSLPRVLTVSHDNNPHRSNPSNEMNKFIVRFSREEIFTLNYNFFLFLFSYALPG